MNLLLAEVAQATQRLADAGVPSPRNDAEELAAFVHGVKRGELHSVKDADFDARYWETIARREQREPLQHITGLAYFRYLELQVGPGVFVPRPETESVVGWAIDAVRAMDVVEPCIVDLCTGSGAIALATAPRRSRAPACTPWSCPRKPSGGPVRTSRARGSTCGRATPWTPSPTSTAMSTWSSPTALHPAHRVGVRRSRGAGLRSRTRPVLGGGRPRPHPRSGTHRTPAPAPGRRRRHRARRHPGRPGAVDLHRGAGLGRRGRPPRPQQPPQVRDGPQGDAVSRTPQTSEQYVYEEAR